MLRAVYLEHDILRQVIIKLFSYDEVYDFLNLKKSINIGNSMLLLQYCYMSYISVDVISLNKGNIISKHTKLIDKCCNATSAYVIYNLKDFH